MRRSDLRWEAIFVDAYRQPYIPFYLTTREFFRLARERLVPGGLVVVNAGHPEGSTQLERVLAAGLRESFSYVARDPITNVNTLLVAADHRRRPNGSALRSQHSIPECVPSQSKWRSGWSRRWRVATSLPTTAHPWNGSSTARSSPTLRRDDSTRRAGTDA
ncbi:MAG TPA: hypothetical protein VGP30_04485 [Candidatus Limnocylindrales bacterium]|nr:hypothetical protein [Candidatus Limnocylindrales bacterium]